MTSAYEINRKNRPKVKGYSLEELGLDNFYQKWKDNELQIVDTEKMAAGIKEDWDRWSSPDANIHERRLKKLLIGAGDTYSDMRTVDSDEWKGGFKDPIDLTNQLATAGILRTIEAAGWLSDKTLGAAGRWTGKNILGLDEGNQQLMGIAAQFAAPSVIKQVPKIPKIPAVKKGVYTAGVRTGLQYKGAKQLAKNLKKVYDENLSRTPSKRVVKVKAESIIDEGLNTPNYKDIVRIAKKNNISLSKAKAYVDLKTKAIRPDQTLNPGTNAGLIAGGKGPYDPNKDEVYIPPEERIGTQKGDPLEARFQYQGSFDFGPNGEIYYNKIDPAGKVAWQFWLDTTAKKSGYMSMKEMIKVMREWPEEDYQRFLHELWDGATASGQPINRFTYTGYAEHKKAKASKKGRLAKIEKEHPDWTPEQKAIELARKSAKTNDMDWLHDTEYIDHNGIVQTDGIGLGDRNDPKNMLALFDSQWKSLKDVTEQVGYGSEEAPGPLFSFSDGTWRKPKQRFYIDVEDPGKKRKQYLRNNPGDIVIKRADNHKIIGNIGSYLRALYPMDRTQEAQMTYFVLKTINPDTGQLFTSLKEFRAHIIKERLNIILRDTNKLPSNATKRKRFIKEAIEADMVDLKEKYPFLKSIPQATEAEITDDFATWRGQENKDLFKMPDLNIGGTKAGGTVKETENWYQRLIDELFSND